MKWTKIIALFILLMVVAGIIINFGESFSVPFSQVIGGIIIGFALSFIVAMLVLGNPQDDK